jgi:hypothetical protein
MLKKRAVKKVDKKIANKKELESYIAEIAQNNFDFNEL